MQIVACKNDNSVNLCFLIKMYFTSFSFLEGNSATVRHFLMVLDRIIVQE